MQSAARWFAAKWLGIVFFVVTLVADRVTKIATDVDGYRALLDNGHLRWTQLHNFGAAGGMLKGQRVLLVAVGVAVLGVLAYVLWTSTIRAVGFWLGWGLLTGGAVGNTMDRVVYGYVIDMFQWTNQRYVFNLSDMAIRYGMLLMLLFWGLWEWRVRRRNQR